MSLKQTTDYNMTLYKYFYLQTIKIFANSKHF